MKNLFLSALALTSMLTLGSCSKDDDNGGGGGSAAVSSLGCATAIINGTATSGVVFNGSASVPYSGGNGASYLAVSSASTGVTGLTATLVAGNLNNGSGVVTFIITGTPASSGTAAFPITLGGQSCSLNLTVNAPAPYLGKWNMQSYFDTVYNYQELVYNGNFQIDSLRGPFNVTNGAYFQFNGDRSYTWLSTGGTTYNGTYVPSSTNYAYGVKLGLLNGPVTNDTTDLYIYTLSGSNMTLNRFYAVLSPNGTTVPDTIVLDRYYVTQKQ